MGIPSRSPTTRQLAIRIDSASRGQFSFRAVINRCPAALPARSKTMSNIFISNLRSANFQLAEFGRGGDMAKGPLNSQVWYETS
jgi:hypothetical protein